MTRIIFFILIAVSVTPMAYAQQEREPGKIVILDVNDKVPPDAKFIQDIKAGGGGMGANCGYLDALSAAKKKSKIAGGNIVKITEVKCPDNWSSCFKVRADIYYMDNISALLKTRAEKLESAVNALVPDTASYAILYVYRPRRGTGSAIQFNLHVDDSVVCRVRNGGMYVVKMRNKGDTRLWARTESRKEVNLFVKPGKAYFLKCYVKYGVFVGEPEFDLVDPIQGYQEFFACYDGSEGGSDEPSEEDKHK